jgi:acyl carrier protein
MLKERILRLIEEQFGREKNTINLTDHLVQDLGGDSVDVLEVAMLLETEFKISISSEESADALIIKDLVKLVETKCQ